MSDTPVLDLPEIAEGVQSQAVPHNEALRLIEARLVRALSRTTTAPPGSPAEGDSYIIPTGSPNTWGGTANQVASYIGGAWSYYDPVEGIRLWVNDADAVYVFTGAAWAAQGAGTGDVVGPGSATDSALAAFDGTSGKLIKVAAAQPYEVGAGYAGVPTASVVLLRAPMCRTVVFAAGLSPSHGVARVAATAQTDFDILKNGVSFGTMRFAAAGTVASFISAGGSTPVAGDVITVVAPASPDATLADIGFILAGTR